MYEAKATVSRTLLLNLLIFARLDNKKTCPVRRRPY